MGWLAPAPGFCRDHGCESALGRLGYLYRREKLLRVKIILAGLVHDAEISSASCSLIIKDLVQLPQFKVLHPLCLNADNVPTPWLAHGLLQEAFDLELLSTNTVRLISVDFGTAYATAKANGRCSLEFPPTARTILRLQPSALPHGWTFRDDLDIPDLPDDLEVQGRRHLALPTLLPVGALTMHICFPHKGLADRHPRQLKEAPE